LWRAGIYCAANRRNLSDRVTTVANPADLTPNNVTHSYTVTGCGNFNGGLSFATPCSDPP